MNKKEFLILVKRKMPPDLPPGTYETFCNYTEKFGGDEYYYPDLGRATKFMDSLAVSFPKDEDISSQPGINITPQDKLTSTILIEKIASRVKRIRNKIFSSSEPPFNWDGAIEWLETESEKYKDEAFPPNDLWHKIIAVSKEANKYHMKISTIFPSLPYVKKYDGSLSSQVTHSVSIRGPDLIFLERETRYLSKETGFHQSSLVIYVLTGIEPHLSRITYDEIFYDLKISDSESLIRNEVVLTIRSKDLTFREMQHVYKTLKKKLPSEKQKPIKDKHLKIRALIKELGSPPRQGQGHYKYWKKAIEKWKIKYPKDTPKTWQNLRDAWERKRAEFDLY